MGRHCILLFLLVTLPCLLAQSRVEDLTILSVDRQCDISSQLVQLTHKIRIENTNASPTKTFLFTIEPEASSYLSYIGATKDSVDLKVTKTSIAGKPDVLTYAITLPSDLSKGKTVDIEVEVVLTHNLRPFPEEITQKDKQFVKFVGNHYIFSPYKVAKQTTKVVLASKNVESYTKLKPSSQADNTISFGPYENVAAWSYSECVIHYENNNPFLTIRSLERTIEVSHWGNIAIEEKIEIVHNGAKLKGSFSRFDYQREPNSGISSIKAFKTLLPAAAKDVYYRDDIGNISTSNMHVKMDSVELTLRPRFPLFGGWKTRYVIGYNVPSYEYLLSEGNQYLLSMRILDHIFDTMVVDDVLVKIILPEGCSNIVLKTPYEMEELPRSLHFTYLDFLGRPVITLKGKNLVENHIQDFNLSYSFPKVYLLREPLLVIVAFMVLFVTVLIYVRLDFSIAPVKAGKTASGSNTGLVESVLKRHAKRAAIYETFDSSFEKLKRTKDLGTFQSTLKSISTEHKTETQAINDLLSKCRTECPELADNVTELQKLDRGCWELYIAHGQATEKFVAGKMNRQQFNDQDSTFNRKRDEIVEKLNAIVKTI